MYEESMELCLKFLAKVDVNFADEMIRQMNEASFVNHTSGLGSEISSMMKTIKHFKEESKY